MNTEPLPDTRPIASNAHANRLARNADVTTPLTPAVAAAATGLPADAPKAPRVLSLQISVVLGGFAVQVGFDGSIEQLPSAIERLCALGATPTDNTPAAPIAAADDLPEGWKLCKKHGAPMRPRNKQNEHWHSHNVGTGDAPLWCKGYRGADSPGYEVE